MREGERVRVGERGRERVIDGGKGEREVLAQTCRHAHA